MNRTERDKMIEAMCKTIDEDREAVMKCFEKAYEAEDHDRFIQLGKRLDYLGLLKASLRKYGISMVGFEAIKSEMDR